MAERTTPIAISDLTGGWMHGPSPAAIPDNAAANLSAVEFLFGLVRKMRRRTQLTATPLNVIPRLLQFFPTFAGNFFLCAADQYDLYRYSGGSWLYLTPIYTTGTATFTNGSAIVTGAGTAWNTNLKAGDKIKLNADGIWCTILQVDLATQVTLTAAYTGVGGSGAYTARKLLSQGARPIASTVFQNKVYFTNGVEPVYRWDGSAAAVEVLAGSPPPARCIAGHMRHLVLANTLEGGNNYPMKIAWSDLADPTDWTPGVGSEAGSTHLDDTPDPIVALSVQRRPTLVAWKEKNIWLGQYVGPPVYYKFQPQVMGVGALAAGSIALMRDPVALSFFLGEDNVYAFDMIGIAPVGDSIKKALFAELNYAERDKIVSTIIPRAHLYLLSFPAGSMTENNVTYVLNITTGAWSRWPIGFSAFGEFQRSNVVSWDDAVGTWSEQMDIWGAGSTVVGAPILVAGSPTTNKVEFFEEIVDSTADAWIETKVFDFGAPQQTKDLDRLELLCERHTGKTAEVTVYTSEDGVTLVPAFFQVVDLSPSDYPFISVGVTGRLFQVKVRSNTPGQDLGLRGLVMMVDFRGLR